MQNLDVPKTTTAWSSLADTIFVHSEHEYGNSWLYWMD